MAALILASQAAWACATCFDPKDQTQSAFLGPTIFMSLLPLAMMAGIGGWIWWMNRRQQRLGSVTPFSAGIAPDSPRT